MSDELTYKASSRAIDLALSAPPQSRDPYRLPVDAAEVGQRQPFETGRAWARDPQKRLADAGAVRCTSQAAMNAQAA